MIISLSMRLSIILGEGIPFSNVYCSYIKVMRPKAHQFIYFLVFFARPAVFFLAVFLTGFLTDFFTVFFAVFFVNVMSISYG